MRLRSLSVSVLAVAALLPLSAVPASADTVASRLSTTTTTARLVTYSPAALYQDEVLRRTNAERTKRGLRPMAKHLCPDGYADRWAVNLARLGRLAHQPLSPILTACRASRVGENVALGNVTPAQLVAMWMASPGHRANILDPAFTHLGVGSHKTATGRTYGVQVFVRL